MKALTIKQPWASLIAHGIKDIENRTWRTNYRGEILIHAGLDTVFDGLMPDGTMVDDWLVSNGYGWYYNHILHGAIIGKVNLVDCVINHPSIWAEKSVFGTDEDKHDIVVWNWILANPVLYDKPILNVKGKLSLWDYENKKL